ncbi:MAG: ABC transporter ATP-binding protein [Solirubrobacterales bacterium]|nr:ABC transporter ATP-binding protein [Solirubrobacterales bacterium]
MLQVKDLRVGYDGNEALKGVSLEIGSGELVALIGANGAGKTTLLRTISGLHRPISGTIEFAGESVLSRSPEGLARDGLVHVPEGRNVFPRMSVKENLLVAAWRRRSGVAEDMDRIHDLFPVLAERQNQHAYTLSGGEQQMLAIGRAMMRQPRLLMLDEPSMGLAPKITREVFDLIRQIHSSGTPVLLVEQNAKSALGLADRAYVLATGEVVASGSPKDLMESDTIQRAYLGGDE